MRADDPVLTVRLNALPVRRPVRIVLDADLSLPLRSRLIRTVASAPVWVVGADDADAGRERVLQSAGVAVLRARRGGDGRLDLHEVMRHLAANGITRVFSEGGPTLGSALMADDLVDEVAIFTGWNFSANDGVPSLTPGGRARLNDAKVFRCSADMYVGKDRLTRYERIG